MRTGRGLSALVATAMMATLIAPMAPARAAGRDLVVLLSREFGQLDPVDLQASDQGILFHLIFSYLYRLNKEIGRAHV